MHFCNESAFRFRRRTRASSWQNLHRCVRFRERDRGPNQLLVWLTAGGSIERIAERRGSIQKCSFYRGNKARALVCFPIGLDASRFSTAGTICCLSITLWNLSSFSSLPCCSSPLRHTITREYCRARRTHNTRDRQQSHRYNGQRRVNFRSQLAKDIPNTGSLASTSLLDHQKCPRIWKGWLKIRHTLKSAAQ